MSDHDTIAEAVADHCHVPAGQACYDAAIERRRTRCRHGASGCSICHEEATQ